MASHSEIREKARTATASAARSDGFWPALAAAVAAPGRWLRHLGRSGGAPVQFGPYTLDAKIGEGGMGVVYRANHALLGRPAAIKLLPPGRSRAEDVKRFEREFRLTSRLSHPNTVAIYDFGRTREGSFYYAMEYVDGLDLQTLVEREGPLDAARVVHLLAQLASALAEAHGAGLVHRDIKPANLMVCERGGASDVLKVLDFGLAKAVAGADVTESDLCSVVGTPLYMSPESVTAPASVDARSDLYALGAVGYFLLTGLPPFTGKNVFEVCAQHVCEAPLPPSARRSGIPPELEALVLSCLAKSPDERPASAAAVRAELLRIATACAARGAARSRQERDEAPGALAA
jgi:serine/threonine-protein kinase